MTVLERRVPPKMPRVDERRCIFPLAPLLEHIDVPQEADRFGQKSAMGLLALRLHIVYSMTENGGRVRVHRWAHRGLMPEEADMAAVALGLHPCQVWGSLWWEDWER